MSSQADLASLPHRMTAMAQRALSMDWLPTEIPELSLIEKCAPWADFQLAETVPLLTLQGLVVLWPALWVGLSP